MRWVTLVRLNATELPKHLVESAVKTSLGFLFPGWRGGISDGPTQWVGHPVLPDGNAKAAIARAVT